MPTWWISPELNRRAGLLIYSSWLVKHKIKYGLNYYVTLLILSDKCSGFFQHIWSQSHYFIALVQGLHCKAKTFWNILQFPAMAPILQTVLQRQSSSLTQYSLQVPGPREHSNESHLYILYIYIWQPPSHYDQPAVLSGSSIVSLNSLLPLFLS